MKLEDIMQLVKEDKYDYSNHAQEALAEREILDIQVKRAILHGKLLETYTEDIRDKSYLILGGEKKPIHVLVGYNKYRNKAFIITVYVPEPPKWITPDKRGDKT
jgi:hypothetical protein